MKQKLFLVILLLSSLAGFVYAEPLNEQIITEKMIWGLPELFGFTYRGEWHFQEDTINYTRIDLRYINFEDNDQHSEFALNIYNDVLSDSFLEDNINQIISYNWSLIEVSGNKIFEGTAINDPEEISLYWISGNNFIRSWNGNDIGTIQNNNLFDFLTGEYLEKYPSTYAAEKINCTDSDEGLNYYVKGYINNLNLNMTFEDYCLNYFDLIEGHCLSNNSNNFTVQYSCPDGCSNGACIPTPTGTCSRNESGQRRCIYYGPSKGGHSIWIQKCIVRGANRRGGGQILWNVNMAVRMGCV